MTGSTATAALRYALIATGLIFILAISALIQVWPSGWSWGVGHSHYLPMILGVYATLGVFLLLAARDPLANRSLIWFTVWSSLAHAAVMAYHSVADTGQMGHLWGDVAALVLTAVVLTVLVRRELPAAGRAELRAAVAR